MSEDITKIGMAPSSPGEFVREEILNNLGLSVTDAAEVLGVRRATLSDFVNGNAALSPEWPCESRRPLVSIWACCCACRLGTTHTA